MHVMVTGGAGFIGSMTAAALRDAGHEVTAVDDLSRGRRDVVPDGVRFVQADVTDVERLLFVLSRRGEMWKKMLLGNPKLNVTINKQFVEKSAPVKDGDEMGRRGVTKTKTNPTQTKTEKEKKPY